MISYFALGCSRYFLSRHVNCFGNQGCHSLSFIVHCSIASSLKHLPRDCEYHRSMAMIYCVAVCCTINSACVPQFEGSFHNFHTQNELVAKIKCQNYRWQSTQRVCFLNFVGHVIFKAVVICFNTMIRWWATILKRPWLATPLWWKRP